MTNDENKVEAMAIDEHEIAKKLAEKPVDQFEDYIAEKSMTACDDDNVASCSEYVVELEDVPEVKVTTTKDLIDEYFDEKRVLISDKVGDIIDGVVGEDEGDMARAYLMSGEMLRSTLALMCYDASGGDGNAADDVASIIEMVSNACDYKEDILGHDYAKDVDDSIKNAMGIPGAILRGDFGFVGNIFGTARDGPKLVADSINAVKTAAGSTIAEVSRGDFATDSPYITNVKAQHALALSIACKIGAEQAGSEECVELCGIFGRNLGVVYAIASDMHILQECVSNKELNQDIIDGKIDLCMMYALDRCGAYAHVNTDDSKWLFKELSREDAFDDGMLRLEMVVRKYSRNAVKAAERLPSGTYRDMLVAMPDYLINELKR